MKYVQRVNGRYRYRRAVPERLREVAGQREIKRALGSTESEAVKRYLAVHKWAEDQLRQWESGGAATPQPGTDLARFEAATRRIAEMGWSEDTSLADELELEERSITAETELDKYRRDEDGNYIGVPDDESAYIRALLGAKKPKPTLLDAKRIYIQDRITGKPNEQSNLRRLERGLSVLQDIVGGNPQLSQIQRLHARYWVDRLVEDGKTPQNIRRTMTPIKAMLNHAELEFELTAFKNPFQKIDLQESEAKNREALPQAVVEAVRSEIEASGDRDLLLIWLLLEWSGARLGEVSGLRTVDLRLSDEIPHVVIEPHDLRPVKTKSSWRKTPLEGFGLEAARDALEDAKGHNGLFPRFYRDRGSDGASQQLMKIIRQYTDDPRHVVHSLRHGVKDRLRLAGVPKEVQDMILGHASRSVGEGYGSERIKLQIMRDALIKAHSLGS